MAGRNLIVRDVVCRIAVAASLPVLGAIAAEDFSDAAMAVEANRLQTESAARSWDLGAPIAGDRVAETRRLQDAVRAGSDPRGNPLWATRLESLVATRER